MWLNRASVFTRTTSESISFFTRRNRELLRVFCPAAAMSIGTPASKKRPALLNIDNINPNVKNVEYAVRGPIVIRASEIEQELENVSENL